MPKEGLFCQHPRVPPLSWPLLACGASAPSSKTMFLRIELQAHLDIFEYPFAHQGLLDHSRARRAGRGAPR